MMISIVIPVHNGGTLLESCLKAVAASDYPNYEIIVVDDCSTDDSATTSKRFAARLLTLSGKPFGPAYARNRGVDIAKGEIILFVDADVVIRPDTLSKIALTFRSHPEYAAMFGSYDQDPTEDDFLSQYKNLTHHFVHQRANQEASTFWSGCGAIRRNVFLQICGFKAERYRQPSIEDIELGYRLRQSGHRIYLNREVQVKHLKRWTLTGWIKTDIIGRAIPWTALILSQRNLPNDLNLTNSQRMSALLIIVALLLVILRIRFILIASLFLLTMLTLLILANWHFGAGRLFSRMRPRSEILAFLLLVGVGALSVLGGIGGLLIPLGLVGVILAIRRLFDKPRAIFKESVFASLILALACNFGFLLFNPSPMTGVAICAILLLIILLNAPLFLFFACRRNLWFSLAAIPFHLVYYLYSVMAFAAGVGLHLRNTRWKRGRHYSQTS